ncbi:hypothetical protein BDM02DRAFT_3184760 [Thelephora ganbajun]|uniref:Uncharacterized protein n=1 Tax=Thelephora ganbajun TaxID=370292 RepID=A0ACB6ZP23_THEGA|nr:hypothetical protein BDM02DRAFT_3184760 [Thelephora ganbajun]
MQPTETELASQALAEESSYRFPYFSANDAVTLGLSLRKRFKASTRYSKGKGLVITVQTIAGHTLFACTVGDLGGVSGVGDVSLDSWSVLEGMVSVVKRTGHSSYYVEKGMSAMAKGQAGVQSDLRVYGGAFPIWLENALCCPIAVVACYSGSSRDDHHLVVTSVKDFLKKLRGTEAASVAYPPTEGTVPRQVPEPSTVERESQHRHSELEYAPSHPEWVTETGPRSGLEYSSDEERRQ